MTRIACAALLLGAVGTATAQPVAPDSFRHERSVTVTAAGPQRLDLDATLLAGTQAVSNVFHAEPRLRLVPQGPPDLRLYTAQGTEVPFLFVPPSIEGPQAISGTIQPIAATKTTSGFEVDFGEAVPSLTRMTLDGIPAPFLKRFRLEGSGDRARWTVLIGEGTAFDLPAERLRSTSMRFAASAIRYLRVTWDDTNSARIALPTAATSYRQASIHTTAGPRLSLDFERRQAEPGHSRFHVRLPGSHLPIEALELTVGGGHLLRDMRVLEARLTTGRGQVEPVVIGRARLQRVVQDGRTAEALRVELEPPAEPDLDLVFDDGDNPPLDLQGVTAVFADLPWIYFESPPGTLIARYGNPKALAPRYDLEAVRASIPAALNVASWGVETSSRETDARPASAPQLPTRGSRLDPGDFKYTRSIPAGPEGLTVLPLDVAAYAHASSRAGRFADVRILDGDGLQVAYLLERRDEPLVLDLRLERREPSKAAGARPGSSEYVVPIPYREIGGTDVVLTTRARVFQRVVRIGVLAPPDRQSRTPSLRFVQTQSWEHQDDAVATPALTLKLPFATSGEIVIEIDEGDNQPLPIERATLLVPSYAMRFFRSDASPLRLAYGAESLSWPRYDLALLSPYVLGQRAHTVETGPEGAAAASTAGGTDPAQTLVSPAIFWGALGLSVVVLLGVVVRLVRRET